MINIVKNHIIKKKHVLYCYEFKRMYIIIKQELKLISNYLM